MLWSPYHRITWYSFKAKKKVDSNDDEFFLAEPVTVKLENENIISSSGIEIGHSSMQGYRRFMEDKHIISDFSTLPTHTLIAIMDGHGGDGAAITTSAELQNIIESSSEWNEYKKKLHEQGVEDVDILSRCLVQAYIKMDAILLTSALTKTSGCTCVSAIITPRHIVCANVGDSRCVIGSNGQVISMSEDHKPSNPEEFKRIKLGGGFVRFDRVCGALAMSRALGDFEYKRVDHRNIEEQLVICIPDIAVHQRQSGDEILLLACDGVWDVMNNSSAMTFLTEVVMNMTPSHESNGQSSKKRKKEILIQGNEVEVSAKEGKEPITAQDMAEALIDLSLVSGSTDNISAIVAVLKKSQA